MGYQYFNQGCISRRRSRKDRRTVLRNCWRTEDPCVWTVVKSPRAYSVTSSIAMMLTDDALEDESYSCIAESSSWSFVWPADRVVLLMERMETSVAICGVQHRNSASSANPLPRPWKIVLPESGNDVISRRMRAKSFRCRPLPGSSFAQSLELLTIISDNEPT